MSDRGELIAGEVAGGDDTPRGRYSEVEATDQKGEDAEGDDTPGTVRLIDGGGDGVLDVDSTQTTARVEITVEEAIEKMGFGPFQVLVCFFAGMLWLADAMELMLLSVLSPAVECEWGLTRAEEASITSVVFVGVFIGSFFWGAVADTIGRKKALLLVDVLVLVFGVLSAIRVAPDDPSGKAFGYPWLLTCRFGVGVAAGGTPQAVTYFSEFLPTKTRGYCIVLEEIWWAIGSMFGALLALGVMDTLGWHWYLGLATIPLFMVLLLFPFVPESARFYIAKGKPEKAKAVLDRVAWYNRRPPIKGVVVSVEKKEAKMDKPELTASYNQETGVTFNLEFQPSSMQDEEDEEEKPLLNESEQCDEASNNMAIISKGGLLYQGLKHQAVGYSKLFTGGMWKTTILLWIIWIGCGWSYYGVVLLTTSIFQYDNHCFSGSSNEVENGTQNASNETTECNGLGDAYYIKIFWTAAAELPGVLVTVLVIEVLGRKRTMAFEFIVAMIGFLLLFICSNQIVTTLFLFVIRAFVTGVFQAVYVYTPEVYPTNIRARALGTHSAISRIGAFSSPYNAQVLFHRNDYAAVSLYAAPCLILAIAAILLPIETKGKSMKDGAH